MKNQRQNQKNMLLAVAGVVGILFSVLVGGGVGFCVAWAMPPSELTADEIYYIFFVGMPFLIFSSVSWCNSHEKENFYFFLFLAFLAGGLAAVCVGVLVSMAAAV